MARRCVLGLRPRNEGGSVTPYPIASATKANFRDGVSKYPLVGDWFPGTTTGAGTTTTVVDSGLSGIGDNEFQEWFCLAGSDAGAPGEYRIVDSFTASTLTLRTANSVAVGNDNAYFLYRLRPDWYTWAWNTIRTDLYPLIYRPITGHIAQIDSTNAGRTVIGMPRNMRDAWRVYIRGIKHINDEFGSALSGYTQDAGTWVTSSGTLTSDSDVDADAIRRVGSITDGYIRFRFEGTTDHATNFRTIRATFRRLDSDNYLAVEGLNSQILIQKKDGGTFSNLGTAASVTLTSGTSYEVEILYLGTSIRVWVDGNLVRQETLTGENLKYLDGVDAGFEEDRGGSPGTALAIDSWSWYDCHLGEYELDDWTADPGSQTITFPYIVPTGHLIGVEGAAPITALTDDTEGSAGAGTLASDTTATLEVQTTDPAWGGLILLAGAAEVLRTGMSFARSVQERTWYEANLREAEKRLLLAKEIHSMPRPHRRAVNRD